MSVSTAMCTSFKQQLLNKEHDLNSDTIKLALIKASPSGTYGAATTNYSDVRVIQMKPAVLVILLVVKP